MQSIHRSSGRITGQLDFREMQMLMDTLNATSAVFVVASDSDFAIVAEKDGVIATCRELFHFPVSLAAFYHNWMRAREIIFVSHSQLC